MTQDDKRTKAPIVTPVGFSDEELLVIQNGVVLEIKRTAAAGQLKQLEHTLKLFHKLEFPVQAAIDRLTQAEEDHRAATTPQFNDPNNPQ